MEKKINFISNQINQDKLKVTFINITCRYSYINHKSDKKLYAVENNLAYFIIYSYF